MNENWLDKREVEDLSEIVRQLDGLDGAKLKNRQEDIYHKLKVILDHRIRNVEISKEIVDVLESVMGKVYEEKNGGSSYGKKKERDGITFVRFNMSNNEWTYDPIMFEGMTYHEPFVDSMNKNASKILDELLRKNSQGSCALSDSNKDWEGTPCQKLGDGTMEDSLFDKWYNSKKTQSDLKRLRTRLKKESPDVLIFNGKKFTMDNYDMDSTRWSNIKYQLTIEKYDSEESEGFKDMIGGKLIDVYPLFWTRNDLEYDE